MALVFLEQSVSIPIGMMRYLRTVGASAPHPMIAAHHIEWVSLQTKAGNQRKALVVDGAPEVTFALTDGDEVEAVYAYCNLHGLWKA